MRLSTVALALALPFPVAFATSPSATSRPAPAGIAFDMPAGWVVGTPSSSMRVAEFALPRAEGDAEDASLVVYYFGGSGGTVQANLDRWIGQIEQPDGSASAEVAKTTSLTSDQGLAMTLVDVSGTYVAEVTPGSTDRFNKPGFRLRATVVQTPEGPYFVKLTGPASTVARWDASFQAFLKSMRTAQPVFMAVSGLIREARCAGSNPARLATPITSRTTTT